MRQGAVLRKIEKETYSLTSQEKLKLVEKLVHQISKTSLEVKKELDWDKLYGVGKELWKGEDAQDYVNRLREDRT